MLDPKFQIPRVMVGGLALGGAIAGCGSDGPGETEVIASLCAAMEECSPEDFEMYYASQEGCQYQFADDLESAQGYSARCGNAAFAYYTCMEAEIELTCGTDACEDEYFAFYDACNP